MLIVPTETLAKSKKKIKVIDCDVIFDDQKKLQKAVDKAKKGAVVHVKGTCLDIALVIDSPRITLQGEGSALTSLEGNGIDPVIWIEGADRAVIQGVELNSGLTGLQVSAARAIANDVIATNNTTGFVTGFGGTLDCNGCNANTNTGFGAVLLNGLTLCGNNSFNGNGRSGVIAHNGIIYANGDLCTDTPVLEFNGNGTSGEGSGIQTFQNGSFFATDAIIDSNNNAEYGIISTESSSTYITNSTVTLIGNSAFAAVLTFNGSSTIINNDPSSNPVTTSNITFTDDYSNFYSDGDYPNSLIFCGPDGGGETSVNCP
jgi:hypothetical protein